VLDGILYVLRTGCQWKAAPAEFGAPSTLHNYFQEWTDKKVFFRLWKEALREYDALEGIEWGWQSVDGAMTKAPLGGEKKPAPTRRIEPSPVPSVPCLRMETAFLSPWRSRAPTPRTCAWCLRH
jgi:transposase